MNPKNLRRVVLGRLIGIIFLLVLLPSTIGMVIYYQQAKANEIETLELKLTRVSEKVQNFMDVKEENLQMLAGLITQSGHPLEEKEIMKYLKEYTQNDEKVDVYYIGMADNTGYFGNGWLPPKDFKVTKRKWYQDAMAQPNGKVSCSEPYRDADTGKLVVTLSLAIAYNSGEKGVIAADIQLTDILNYMSSIRLGENDYLMLVSQQNDMIYHPNQDFLPTEQKSYSLDQIKYYQTLGLDKNTDRYRGTITDYNGVKSQVVGNKLVGGWQIYMIYPTSELLSGIRVTAGVIYLVLLLMIGITLFSVRNLMNPLVKSIIEMSRYTHKMVGRDLSQRMTTKRKDEVGLLVQDLNELSQVMSGNIGQNKALAKKTKNLSEVLKEITDQSFKELQQVQNALAEVVGGIGSQKEALVNMRSLAHDVIDGINTIESSAASRGKEAEKYSHVAAQNLNQAKALEYTNQEMREALRAIRGVIGVLVDDLKDINHFAEVIKGMARQTSMLSFNATIEAARAGDAGKGFKVVADEIRKLSESTNNVSSHISDITVKLGETVNQMTQDMNKCDAIFERTQQFVQSTSGIFEGFYDHAIHNEHSLSEENRLLGAFTKQLNELINHTQKIADIIGQTTGILEDVFEQIIQQVNKNEEIIGLTGELEGLSEKSNENFEGYIL
ncbi:MAG: methyl-accepting chemotaxis protein [Cellulosilyticaceae bacterium]